MDYCIGQLAQTMAKLAQSNQEVGTDAWTVLGDATVRMTIGDASVKYTCSNDRDKSKDDKNRGGHRPFRRPKLELQYPGCKLWGHDDSTCNFLA
jgi:hypothetical protein